MSTQGYGYGTGPIVACGLLE